MVWLSFERTPLAAAEDKQVWLCDPEQVHLISTKNLL